MTSNAIDYFATLGRVPGEFVCRTFESTDELHNPSDVWNNAITDIELVLHNREKYDLSWEILETTLDGTVLELPHLAIRRRLHSGRLDHITALKILEGNEVVPKGFEVLRPPEETSAAKSDANGLLSTGSLVIRRADTSTVMFIEGEPMVDDLYIKAPADERLEGYFELHSQSGLSILYRFHQPLGLCDLSYASSTLDRYPLQDHINMPLPTNELPLFAFPSGMRLVYNSLNRFPLPVFFTLVFTDVNGDHLYAACLRFYEAIDARELSAVFRKIYGAERSLDVLPGSGIFCPKVISVVSRRPFYRAMRRYLRQMYSLSLSTLSCPLEFFVTAVVGQVPLPAESGRPFHVMLDAALISDSSRAMAPVMFELHDARFFPHMDLDFAAPLRCMSVENLLVLFALLLRESKVLFLCRSNTLLTETMETMRMLLFPLTWSSCFISRLPESFFGVLEAPGGFMVGIHDAGVVHSELGDEGGANPQSRNKSTIFSDTVAEIVHTHSIPNGAFMVDLSSNIIFQHTKQRMQPLTSNTTDKILKTLPVGPRVRLQHLLNVVAAEYQIGPQLVGLEEFDSAFDFQSQDDRLVSAKKWEEFPTLKVRDAFMVFMADLLGDYPKYIIPPLEDMAADTYRTFKEEFAVNDYLADADSSCRQVLEQLMETQMFAVLLQQRSEGSQYSLVFFEQASNLLRELGLRAGGHGFKAPKEKSQYVSGYVSMLPAALHELLDADFKWASLSTIMQQQILSERINMDFAVSSDSTEEPSSPTTKLRSSGSQFHLSYVSANPANLGMTKHGNASSLPRQAVHSVLNAKLSNLLTMLSIMEYTLTYDPSLRRSSSIAECDPNRVVAVASRKELDRCDDLMLHDSNYGPLILPGPVLGQSTRSNESEAFFLLSSSLDGEVSCTTESTVVSESSLCTYSYPVGWPFFDQQLLLESAKRNVHLRIKEIQKDRVFANERINHDTVMFVRSPSERLSYEIHGKLRNEIKLDVNDDAKAAVSAILDIASTCILLLATRSLAGLRPANDVLQILGVLSQIEHWGLLRTVNESTWRSILIACASVGGNLMRRIACVVFECVNSFIGEADALTYGQYITALSSVKSKLKEDRLMLLDQFYFLEEMGFTWYVQRSALIEHEQIIQQYSAKMGGNSSPAAMFSKSFVVARSNSGDSNLNNSNHSAAAADKRKHYSGNKHKDRGYAALKTRRLVVRASTEAAQLIFDKFDLVRSAGVFTFMRPRVFHAAVLPTEVRLFSNQLDDVTTAFHDTELRMDKFNIDAMPVPMSVVHSRSATALSSALLAADAEDGSHTESAKSVMNSASQALTNMMTNAGQSGSSGMMSRVFSSTSSVLKAAMSPQSNPDNQRASDFGTDLAEVVKNNDSDAERRQSSDSQSGASNASPSMQTLSRWTSRIFSGGKSSSEKAPEKSLAKDPETAESLDDVEKLKRTNELLAQLSEKLHFDDEEDNNRDSLDLSEYGSRKSQDSRAWDNVSVDESKLRIDEGTSLDEQRQESSTVENDMFAGAARMEPMTTSLVIAVPAAEDIEEGGGTSNTESSPGASISSQHDDDHDVVLAHEEEKEPHVPTEYEKQRLRLREAESVDLVDLQDRIISSLNTYYQQHGVVVGLHSYTACAACDYAMMDDEIVSLWCRSELHSHYSSSRATASPNVKPTRATTLLRGVKREDSRQMSRVHGLACPQCTRQVNPLLKVVQYSLDETAFDGVAAQQVCATSLLSPFGLRFELEEKIHKIGEKVADPTWLLAYSAEVYWGVVWYSTRFSLPIGLLPTNTSFCPNASTNSKLSSLATNKLLHNSPFIVGWRENVVRVKALRLLRNQPKVDVLTVKDLFPSTSDADLQMLQSLLPALDGSLIGMRSVMLGVSACSSVLDSPQLGGSGNARKLYVILLTLCYSCECYNLVPKAESSLKALSKDVLFERVFSDTVKCVLSRKDVEAMACKEKELLQCVATRPVQVMRSAFGFLF